MEVSLDQQYLQILTNRLEVCKSYQPKFGQGNEGLTFDQFYQLYHADPLYAWFGLDHPLMYAAHTAAGGITSIYRQLGIGVEELFRQILHDHLGLLPAQINWSYQVQSNSGKMRTLKLDGRIDISEVSKRQQREALLEWMYTATTRLAMDERMAQALRGVVVEVRQGYKSKDSKRQNADIANATEAYLKGYLPILMLFSSQIDLDIIERYERGKWLVLRGVLEDDPTISTYAFMKEVIGYDLAGFFARQQSTIREITLQVLESLLRPDDLA
ncbi:MAG: hypothetical protein ACOYLB_05475 [Phototrophicaceae bacterium]